tara:strand:+ start:490 stop:726 length:237 start_codon:yes stop_codon:yes gene_type:complete
MSKYNACKHKNHINNQSTTDHLTEYSPTLTNDPIYDNNGISITASGADSYTISETGSPTTRDADDTKKTTLKQKRKTD